MKGQNAVDKVLYWCYSWVEDYAKISISADHYLSTGDDSLVPPFDYFVQKWQITQSEIRSLKERAEDEILETVHEFLRDSQESLFFARIDRMVGEFNRVNADQVLSLFQLLQRAYPDNIHAILILTNVYIDIFGFKETLVKFCKKSLIVKSNPALFLNLTTTDIEPRQAEPGVKLKWNCKPAVAGYIISELIRAGYLEPPVTHGELSLTRLAGICNQLFEIKDHTPTVGSWRNVVDPERNTLSDSKRAKLNLPDLDQLT